jgi:hypothetical protein
MAGKQPDALLLHVGVSALVGVMTGDSSPAWHGAWGAPQLAGGGGVSVWMRTDITGVFMTIVSNHASWQSEISWDPHLGRFSCLLVLWDDDDCWLSDGGGWVLIWGGFEAPGHHESYVDVIGHAIGIAGGVREVQELLGSDACTHEGKGRWEGRQQGDNCFSILLVFFFNGSGGPICASFRFRMSASMCLCFYRSQSMRLCFYRSQSMRWSVHKAHMELPLP